MHVLNCTNCELYESRIVSGSGCVLTDSRGKTYVDFDSGVWCTALGHSHPQITRALAAQAGSIAHTGYFCTAEIVEQAAAALLRCLGLAGGSCVFLSSGSEAVEFAVRAAGIITGKPKLLCFENYFLSSYGSAAAKEKSGWISIDLAEYSSVQAVSRFLGQVNFSEVAGFVLEPGNASGAVRLPPPDIVAAVADRVRAGGGLVIVDEVTTGIGRTGRWFGFEHYSLQPDIVACGKGLGNGYPVSAVAMRAGYGHTLLQSGFHYAQSHQNDPLGCAVAHAVLTCMEKENLIEKAAPVGIWLKQQLLGLAARHSCIKEVRGTGLMLAVELHSAPAAHLAVIHRRLFEAGFLAGFKPAANLLRFYPPLMIGRAEIDAMILALDQILTDSVFVRANTPAL